MRVVKLFMREKEERMHLNIGAIRYSANTCSSVGDLYNFVMCQDPCLTDYF